MQAFTPPLPVTPTAPCWRIATSFTCSVTAHSVNASRRRPRSQVRTPRAVTGNPPTLADAIHEDLRRGELQVAITRIEDAIAQQTDRYMPVVTYHYLHDLLYQASRCRQWDVAIRSFYAMESTGLYCVRSTSYHLFSALARAGRVKEAEEAMAVLWKPFITLFDGSRRELEEKQLDRRRPDEKMVTTMANSAVEIGRPDIAVNALKELDRNGVQFTVFTASVLIKAHGRHSNADGVTKVLAGLGERGIEPDLIIFNTAIDAYVRCGEKAMARRVLRAISRRGLTPNAMSYNPILREIAQSGKLEDALALRREMERRHIKPSPYTYNALIQACVTAKRWGLAMEFLMQSITAAERRRRYARDARPRGREGVESELAGDGSMSKDVAVGFTIVISGLAVDGDIKGATLLLDEMVKRIERSGKTDRLEKEIGIGVTAILSALLSKGDVAEAWRWFRWIRKRLKIQLPPDSYNAMIRGLARGGDLGSVEAAEKMLYEMIEVFEKKRSRGREEERAGSGQGGGRKTGTEAGREDISLAYNTVMDGYSRIGKTEAGERLLDEMEAKGEVATVVTYTTLMNGYGKEGSVESTRRVLRRMRDAGVSADRVTMNAVIGACVRAGDMRDAMRVLEEMQRVGGRVSPNLVTFSAIIAGLVRENRKNEAWEMYEEMKGVGIVPNERLLERMMAVFVAPERKPGRGEVGLEGGEGEEGLGAVGGSVGKEVVGGEGWTWERARVLLTDMEACRCSAVNVARWRRAVDAIWTV